MLDVRILRLPHAEGLSLPAYETADSAGCDLRAAIRDVLLIKPGAWVVVPTGLCIELPSGYEAQVRPRSGLAAKHGVTVLNAPGTIDADYRGEIRVPLINLGPREFGLRRGDRIAQMVIAPVIQVSWVEAEALGTTERGANGFGSTGR